MNPKLGTTQLDGAVLATLKSTQAYCTFIDSVKENEITQVNFINKLHILLVELYQNAIQLPTLETSDENEKKNIEFKNNGSQLTEKLSIILEGYTDYSKAFDPVLLFDEANYMRGWLVDDLIDIYNELNDINKKIKKGTEDDIQKGIYNLKYGLSNHWGHNLMDALRFIHYVRYNHIMNS